MNFKIATYLAFFTYATAGISQANDDWYVVCKKACASCTQGSCSPDANTYEVKATYTHDQQSAAQADADARNAADSNADCSVTDTQPTSGGGQAAGDLSPGVTTLNYKREGIVFDGVGPDYVKYETVGGVKKPLQMPTKTTTVIYSDLGDATGYQAAQYLTGQLSAPNVTGVRSVPAGISPISVTIYRNPDGTANTTVGRLDVVHKQKHPQTGAWVTTTIRLNSPQGSNGWKREWFLGDPLQNTTLTPYQVVDVIRTPNLNGTETVRETTRVGTSDGSLVIRKDQTLIYGFYKYANPVVISQVDHTGTGSELTTTQTYYTNASDQVSFNKPATLRRSDGQWANYNYSGSFVTGVIITKTVSGWLDNAAPAAGTPADESANRVVTEIEAKNETGTFGREERVQGVLISKTWGERYKDNSGQVIEKSRVETGTATLLTIRTGYPTTSAAAAAERGQLKSIEFPDGTVELHRYQLQGTNQIKTVDRGAGSLSAVTAGRRTVSTTTSEGTLIKEVVSDIASGVELSAREAIAFDANARPTRWAYNHNPEDYSETLYGCCGVDQERSRDGIVKTYTHDALKRPLTQTSRGQILTFSYLSRSVGSSTFLATNITLTGGGLIADQGTTVMDHAGNELLLIKPDINGDSAEEITTINTDFTSRTKEIIYPDGSTKLESSYADGQRKSLSGTSAIPYAWDYSIHDEGGGGILITTFSGHMSSPKWNKSYQNLAGFSFKSTASGSLGEIVLETTYFDEYGRIIKTVDGDGVTQLFGYNNKGDRYRTAIDLNRNGFIDEADRITDVNREIVNNSTIGPAIRVQTVTYDASNNPLILETSWKSIDGLVSEIAILGESGSLTTAVEPYVSRVDGTWMVTTIFSNGTKKTENYTNWQIVNTSLKDTHDSELESSSVSYDSLSRAITQTDSRTGAVTASYGLSGLISSINDHGKLLRIGYDNLGRTNAVIYPDNSSSNISYWPNGLEKARWGAETNPTVKLYNEQGQLIELRTFRALNLSLSPDENTVGYDGTYWEFDNRGRMSKKYYSDNQGVNYTYTLAGRLKSRTWARGVATVYEYNNAGELIKRDYSDATPDVIIDLDKLGRQVSINNGVARSNFIYDPLTSRPVSEKISYDLNRDGVVEFSRLLEHNFASSGRLTGYILKAEAATSAEQDVNYSYSSFTGRVNSVSSEGDTFSYEYQANSSLVKSVTGPAHVASNTWAEDQNILVGKTNTVGDSIVSKYQYTLNSISQRISVEQTGNAYFPSSKWDWNYDILGQIVSATHNTNSAYDRSYQYDAIGNRVEANEGSGMGMTQFNYMSNSLNHYSSINHLGTTISPAYDNDGNMLSGPTLVGIANLSWDAENRLISVTIGGETTNFAYDALSRRISLDRNNDTRIYVYDEWNIIAEYTFSNYSFSLSKTYLWGLDLSGSMQGAGGVGGLLKVSHKNENSTSKFYPTYDGTGNISEYLDGDGDVAAHFEYDSFGKLIVDTDFSKLFPIRFSTKQLDFETGLYYYGYRYYNVFTGRWLNRDFIGEADGANVFAFLRNSAIQSVDVSGLNTYNAGDRVNCSSAQAELSISAYDILGGSATISISGEKCDCCDSGTRVDNDYFNLQVTAQGTLGVGAGSQVTVMGYRVGTEIRGPQLEIANHSIGYSKDCGEPAHVEIKLEKAFDLGISGTIGSGFGIEVGGHARVSVGLTVEFEDREWNAYGVVSNEVFADLKIFFRAGSYRRTWHGPQNEEKHFITSGTF